MAQHLNSGHPGAPSPSSEGTGMPVVFSQGQGHHADRVGSSDAGPLSQTRCSKGLLRPLPRRPWPRSHVRKSPPASGAQRTRRAVRPSLERVGLSRVDACLRLVATTMVQAAELPGLWLPAGQVSGLSAGLGKHPTR